MRDTENDDIEMDVMELSDDTYVNQSESSGSSEVVEGDIVLANLIARMQDAMLHYEFTHAVASSEIGRALEVMNASSMAQ
jgi:hypothetical protein